ncbi:hypothetical protein ACRALDRAFT_1043623 [Sodiomyces alcalophilus JCM 7366]|uniref:uncharacterized protein n=1 Tax=Sodiomyces alcalophilus JCM 7366 TaxID=591952 RepID=UPI0039B3A6EB
MGFARCEGPIWRVDDLSRCFQQDYLQVLFPLITIAISLLVLVFHNAPRAAARLRRKDGYQSIPTDPDHLHAQENTAAAHTDVPPEEQEELLDDDDEPLTMNPGGAGRLSLVKTTTRGSVVSVVQADSPQGQSLSMVVEKLAIAGLVAVHIIALLTDGYGQRGELPAIAGLVVWLYVAALATLRLVLGNTKWRLPRLWFHTATIYGCQWLYTVAIFRSVIIHPSSRTAQVLVIVEFALISLLFGMAITTRKGNKTVLLEWEDGIEPSREPLASLLSLATFSWVDPIVWRGYKETFEMKAVWNLLPKDKAAAVLADYRTLKRTTSLAIHLLKYFKKDLILQCALAIIGAVFAFAPTLLLKAILEYVEQPDNAPINVIWLYVILLPILDLVRSFGDGMSLWIGRKICIRIRAIIVGEIYAKALRRKAAAGKDTVLGADSSAKKNKKKDGDGKGGGIVDSIKQKLGLKQDDDQSTGSPDADADAAAAATTAESSTALVPEKNDEQVNLGTIINLMSVDSFKIAESTSYLHFLFACAPTQLILCVVLLWRVMGVSAIPGLIVMAFLLPINYGFARGFTITSKKILAATDKRINVTNEILNNIRIIKYFAWEERFGRIVDDKRLVELRALRSRFLVWSCAVAVWNSVPVVITFFSFFVYTVIQKKPLYPSVAFTAISLFMLLRIPLDQFGDMFARVQETKVSLDRVEEFFMEDETEKYEQLGLDNIDENGNHVIGLRDATFIWGGRDTVADDGSLAFRLLDINVDFKIGHLNVISGPTGSGKTSMLMALLGEMTRLEGRVYCPGGRSREDVRPDPETGLANTIAYVAQSAWLVNATIKENILFSAEMDEDRYKNVIVACALERDFEILDHGDETLVGEKGITLSGGQKQRISLARALYSNSQHLLLDDCLSAVDSHTAHWIFHNAIRGPLMIGRTCILVTHNIQLAVPSSHYVVVMDNGRVSVQGPTADVIASGKLGEDLQRSRPSTAVGSRMPSRVPSSVGENGSETIVNPGDENGHHANGAAAEEAKKKKKKQPTDAVVEHKAEGAVKWPIMRMYIGAMGPWWFWIVAAIVFTLQQLSGVATNVWVRQWANEYVTEEVDHIEFTSSSHSYSTQSITPTYFAHFAHYGFLGNATGFGIQAVNEVNVAYYLTGLAFIGLAGALTAFIRDLWIFFGSLTASKKIHTRLMESVSRAKFKFFDVTPLGQIMNRFSKDLEAVDQEVAPIAIGVISCALGIVVTVVLIAIITPGFLIAGVFITVAYWLVGSFYIRASRDLKRLESVQRSPLFQQFGETLSGMTTIRAYGAERRFIRENLAKINTQARPFIYLWACNRWLSFRTDLLGDLVSFFAGVFVILGLGKIDAGAAGISLSYAIGFTDNVLWLVRLYALNEQNMNSVERVKEYLDVEQEAAPVVEKNRPPANWPAQGSIEFINYSTSYRKELEPVLRNLSFKINPREKVGIVGRTGAGKSSLTLAIFRALEAVEGKILIDDVDIGLIGLRDLREAVTIVPQDPTLFMGTIRSNLDPFHVYTDEQIFEALRKVQLIGPDESATRPQTPASSMLPSPPAIGTLEDEGDRAPSPTGSGAATNRNVFLDLSTPVSESGSNLSQGQRQLMCLARAILKNPSVLVMDEATASIDHATDSKIQETIREQTSTIITIAHRLQTIVDYDKVLVLDKGVMVEYGHPYELMRNEEGHFRGMCESSGDYDALAKAAKQKWDAGRLVDVDDE